MNTPNTREYRIVALICVAEMLTMAAFASYASFLPRLRIEWTMTAAQAGFISGAFFFGYMVTVPVLSSLTDRTDARKVYLAACCLNAAGVFGFAFLAQGMYSGAFFQAITGIGLAGTYMPGLKVLTDRVEGPRQSRYISFYTASFGFGTTLSLLASGWVAKVFPWRTTMALLALGPLLAASIMYLTIERKDPVKKPSGSLFSQFGDVWSLGEVRRYIYGYAAHCMEIFGVRSWLVAFFTFAFGASGAPVSPTEAAAIINLFGTPASILGNEAANRVGRKRWIVAMMLLSGTLCWTVGFTSSLAWWLIIGAVAVYFVTAMLDSASLTAGLIQATPQEFRGAAMAIYSFLGFGIGFIAPLVFGATLDYSGGSDRALSWTLAFGILGLCCLVWGVVNLRSEDRR
ncbi:MAG: MFS transporter [Candidatus Accumulibacter sp.]|jgi:MFS family permease|nr:MFS transporter [Accumulibacter sp.]